MFTIYHFLNLLVIFRNLLTIFNLVILYSKIESFDSSWIMFKFPLQHQKKQKILNYEIKLIEECSDSLFNSKNCKHQRYLDWELCSVLEDIIKHQQYHLRWIGNDPNAYVYAYFYTAIVACSSNPSFLVELKCVLYQLAERYLCIYEKKLLI